ncbi:MAG: hypothetical protein WC453_04065 [Patescibacteria group bacterium]
MHKQYNYKQICEILKIHNHNYPLPQRQIEEYFNYFINYFKGSNPINLLETNHTLGLCHGLYILMFGRDLHDINVNYGGSLKSKKELFRRFSKFDKDIMSEVAVLGELSRNGCKLELYSESHTINPEALLYLGNEKYNIDVTKIHWETKEELGLVAINSLLENRPDILNKYNNKTIIVCPKKSFQIFIKNILSDSSITDICASFPDEVRVHDGALACDAYTGFVYEIKEGGLVVKIVVEDIMGSIHSKLIDKSQQYINSRIGLVIYLDLSGLYCMDIKQLIWRVQNSLKCFLNISAVAIFDRFAIDFDNFNFDLFNGCYLIINEFSNYKIDIDYCQKNLDINRLILSKDNLITNTNGTFIIKALK